MNFCQLDTRMTYCSLTNTKKWFPLMSIYLWVHSFMSPACASTHTHPLWVSSSLPLLLMNYLSGKILCVYTYHVSISYDSFHSIPPPAVTKRRQCFSYSYPVASFNCNVSCLTVYKWFIALFPSTYEMSQLCWRCWGKQLLFPYHQQQWCNFWLFLFIHLQWWTLMTIVSRFNRILQHSLHLNLHFIW